MTEKKDTEEPGDTNNFPRTLGKQRKELFRCGRRVGQSFGAKLGDLRKSKRLTQRRAARLIGVTERALQFWESGKRIPSRPRRARALRVLRESDSKPSKHFVSRAKSDHHIDWEKGRGWFMRVTILHNKKQVGKRVKVRLKTRDLEEAIIRRDIVLSSYRAMGFQMPK